MKFNTKIRYSLRMVVSIAKEKKIINTTELGTTTLVSPKYLRKLAGPLERAGIIKSTQGIYGGYTLNYKPEEISVKMILDACNERIDLVECLGGKKCALDSDCLIKPVWRKMENLIMEQLKKITVRDIIERKVN